MVSHFRRECRVICSGDRRFQGATERGSQSLDNDALSSSPFARKCSRDFRLETLHFFLRSPSPSRRVASSRFYFVHAHSAGILLVLFPPPGSLDCRDLICIPLLRHERSSLANGERFVVRRAQRRKRVEGRIGEEREREKEENFRTRIRSLPSLVPVVRGNGVKRLIHWSFALLPVFILRSLRRYLSHVCSFALFIVHGEIT